MLRYARPYRRGWAAIFFVTLGSIGFGLLGPWPMKLLFDNVLDDKPLPSLLEGLPGTGSTQGLLILVVAGGLLIFALNSLFEVVMSYLYIRVGQSMVYSATRDLFARIQRRSLLYHSRTSVGDSMTSVADDAWVVHTVVDEVIFTPLYVVITIASILFIMLELNAGLTLLTLAVAPPMGLLAMMFGKRLRSVSQQTRAVEVGLQSHVQQTLAGVHVVQAFAQEDRHGGHFHQLAGEAIQARVRGIVVGGLNGLASGLVGSTVSAVVLFLGARAVLDGTLTVGSLLVFYAYATTLQQQLAAITGIYATLQGARASTDRVLAVLDTEPEVSDRPGAQPLPSVSGHVHLEGVTFGYQPGRPVLHEVSLEAHPGERLAIVGATGAGKSTLVSLIPRFFDPDVGRVLIDGHDVRVVQLKSLRSQISLVLQESFLFPISIADNIAYGRPDASREEIEAAARAANAHRFIDELPEGYDTVVGERGATLSGGERQRIAIARALLKDAPILILDEPTSALDAETESLLLEALDRLMVGRTTFIIAHRLSTIRAANRIVVLADGKIVEEGPHQELLERGEAYARLHALQMGSGKQEEIVVEDAR